MLISRDVGAFWGVDSSESYRDCSQVWAAARVVVRGSISMRRVA